MRIFAVYIRRQPVEIVLPHSIIAPKEELLQAYSPKIALICRSLASWTCQRFTRPFPCPLTACVVLCGVPSVVMPWVCLFVGTMAARGKSNATTGGLYQDM